jgi:tight adherence protein C
MTLTLLLLGIGAFLGTFILLFVVLSRTSAESVLLEEVTRPAGGRGGEGEGSSSSLRSALSVDRLAKPFAVIRSLLGGGLNPDLVRRLMLAGYRKQAHVDIFLGARLAVPALLGFGVALLVSENVIFFFFLAIVLGFFLPDLWLGQAIKRRRARIKLSLPDGLDLLSICMEAGLGLDQGIVRVGQELRVSHPDLSDELLQVNFEQRAGVTRIAAWKAFADRADVESVRSFVAMLIQTDRFGTPIAKSLGAFSDALRTQRRQRAEEMAAKTTVKLVPPMVIFILPDVFIVTVAPAVITVMRSMSSIVG